MWIFSFLPPWFAALVATVGFTAVMASVILNKIPMVRTYSKLLKYGGGVVFVLGIFCMGIVINEQKWLDRVKELEEKVAQAEEQAKQKNVVIQEKIIEKDKIIKEKGDVVVQYVDRVVKGDTEVIVKNMTDQEKAVFNQKIEELQSSLKNCSVPQLILEMHNEAAKSPLKESKK